MKHSKTKHWSVQYVEESKTVRLWPTRKMVGKATTALPLSLRYVVVKIFQEKKTVISRGLRCLLHAQVLGVDWILSSLLQVK
jgi:hypothetical protein